MVAMSPSDRARLELACRRWRVSELWVFGSASRGELREDSDVDLLVAFQPGAGWSLLDLVRMEEELAEVFGRPVDLLTRGGLESSRNDVRRAEILSTARVVYAA